MTSRPRGPRSALLLRKRSHRVTEVEGVAAAVKALTDDAFDVIVTDLRMPDGDGLDVLRAARAHCPDADVILLTAYAGWESAKEAIQLGACDYFEKGREPDELLHRIDKALAEKALRRENANLRAQVRDRYALPGLVTGSAQMAQVLDLVRRVAPTDATVLIHGESGSGKEVIAKAIHHASQRARGSFVAINCAALPETLLESRALRPRQGGLHGRGHEQEGAVRGSPWRDALARRDRRDAAEPAGQAPAHAPERRDPARRRDAAVTIDVRVVAATNRDLAQMIRQGSFREDLFYRLNVIPVRAAAAARAPRGHSAPGRALPGPLRRAAGPRPAPEPRRHGAPAPLPVARQCPGARKCHGAERHPRPGRHDRAGRSAPHVAAGLAARPRAEPRIASDPGRDRADPHHAGARALGLESLSTAESLGIGRTTLWRKLKEYGIDR